MTSAQKHLFGGTSSGHATAATLRIRCRTGKFIALAAVLGLALVGCGMSNDGATATTKASAAAEAPPSAAAGGTASPMESTSPRPAASMAPVTSAPATSAAPALCTAASLKGSLDDNGGGAAGLISMKLVLTNKSTTTCILNGYPGVSLVKTGSTQPIGAPAQRDASAPSKGPISLAPGKSASAVLNYTQAENYPACQRVQAEDIMVYPPSAYDRLVLAHPLTACSNVGTLLMTVGAFQP